MGIRFPATLFTYCKTTRGIAPRAGYCTYSICNTLVQRDICEKLSIDTENTFRIFRQSFERPNLSYSVFRVDSRINKIVSVLKSVKGSAIVYCKTRKRSKEISELLNAQNINADFYNAGLPSEERAEKQERWIKNQTRVIVCTNAFGMGIDKPDVRVVVHADVPDCLENYYQEAGRAGRDGENRMPYCCTTKWSWMR